MKSKAKIIATVVSIMLVLAVMGVGVFAAVQTGVGTANGTVSFNATGVYVSVEGEISDLAGSDFTDRKYTQKNYDPAAMNTSSLSALANWEIGNAELTEANTYVEYTLKITNDSDFKLSLVYTAPSDITGLSITAVSGSDSLVNGGNLQIEKNESATIKIKAELVDFSKSINGAFTFGITLSKAV